MDHSESIEEKPRSGCLFIDAGTPPDSSFCFSAALKSHRPVVVAHCHSPTIAATEKQKEKRADRGIGYKQATPTGFTDRRQRQTLSNTFKVLGNGKRCGAGRAKGARDLRPPESSAREPPDSHAFPPTHTPHEHHRLPYRRPRGLPQNAPLANQPGCRH